MTGIELIATERQRQIDGEGYSPEHDQAFEPDEELAIAAVCYALPASHRDTGYPRSVAPTLWPWADQYWKPTPDDRVRELVKAGALIAAEIDRLSA